LRLQQLEALIEPAVQACECELWGVELSQAKRTMLRVYIDSPEGITVDDCARVSRQVSGVLDVEDPISGEYTLEVSSPGADRLLFRPEHYQLMAGSKLNVKLRYPFEGRRKFKGFLIGLEEQEVVLRVDDGAEDHELLLPLESIERSRVIPEF
jgi:ribosome maturation factor RimP